ncbi:MAG: DUF2802 domain-containing protein [Thermodesulfobacteriota bacterium]|nr:DUF2802 domain-containing protein [Thermodesulfobacteriota bacterium]
MSDIQMGFWVFLQIAIDIVLLVIVCLYVVREKKRRFMYSPEEIDEERLKALSDSIQQMIKESKRVLHEIQESINKQKDSLNKIIEKLDRKKEEMDRSMEEAEKFLQGLKRITDRDVVTADEEQDKYQQVLSLSQRGLSIDEIGKRVELPRGEVELILDLKKE